MSNENKGSSFWELALSFLAGAATGFILGVLFAPASGKETREKIKEGAVKAGEKAVMVLNIDGPVSDKVLKELEKVKGLHSAKLVSL